ncbi:MAG: hypothetical protein SWX82_19930 [Cyanobacteriota bacterium]|nr:hypothetical protein [Cyanobacteriota bacterium]
MISCPVASVLYREGKEEGRRKKEEGRSFKRRKNFTHKVVDISPTFTRDYTNGHDIIDKNTAKVSCNLSQWCIGGDV